MVLVLATQAYPLKVFGQPQEKGGKDHSITTFYAVPVSLDCDGQWNTMVAGW